MTFEDIIGQEEGIKLPQSDSLRRKSAACADLRPARHRQDLCGAFGAGGGEAKSRGTPFAKDAPFIEMDATCVRFDERAIADPLIGSVHDPIYQGAGPLGVQGIPQPKPGAVSKRARRRAVP